jgi:hypothetical protein
MAIFYGDTLTDGFEPYFPQKSLKVHTAPENGCSGTLVYSDIEVKVDQVTVIR